MLMLALSGGIGKLGKTEVLPTIEKLTHFP